MRRAQTHLLPDQRRLHLHDGPIDLILEAIGDAKEVERAYRSAALRFETVLDELCSELPLLRARSIPYGRVPEGVMARRMAAAVAPFAQRTFITPMAAVAGSVAEEILGAMTSAARLDKAYVNNGGDIALHLTPGQHFVVGMVDRPERPSLFGNAYIGDGDRIRGIATSGWRGRSFSLGIADSVTVLADSAAGADAAATIVANSVDLAGHCQILRVPARELSPDSDLGDMLVTQRVGALSRDEIDCALSAGVSNAQTLLAEGLIRSAALSLQGETRVCGAPEYPTPVGDLKMSVYRSFVCA